MEVVGGPRVRLFSTLEREQRTTWLTYWIRGQLDRLLAVAPVGWRRTIIENFPQTPPALKKVPLLRGHGPQYLNAHDIDHGVYHQTNGVLLHFKFTADFAEKIEREIQRQEHYRFGAEYILYNKYILRQGPIALYSESESGTFETAEDLIRLKLIRDVSEYFS